MATRLFKEVREMWLFLAGSILLIEVPFLIWGARVGDAGFTLLALGCMIMAANSFGHEFQHRTTTLLLAQPLPRRTIWREKTLVLGAALALSAPVLWWNLHRFSVAYSPAFLVLIPLCAFCGGPWLTLQSRSGIVGAVAVALVPGLILSVISLVMGLWLDIGEERIERVMIGSLFAYCVVSYVLGCVTFKQFQLVDVTSRELALPYRLEAWLGRSLGGVSSRFAGPVAALVKKELRLQQFAFVAAGLFVAASICGAVLFQRPNHNAAAVVLVITFALYLPLLPILIGGISTAEERGWGFSEWHLTLPPSALRQWNVKSFVTLTLGFALGLLLPIMVYLAIAPLTGGLKSEDYNRLLEGCTEIVLGQLLLTSLASYTGTFSRSTLRAILLALGIIALFGQWLWLLGKMLEHLWQGPWDRPEEGPAVGPLIPASMFLGLLLLQRFAFANFKRGGQSVWNILLQLGALFALAAVVALTILLWLAISFPNQMWIRLGWVR